MGSSKFINQEIQMYYLTEVVHNGMSRLAFGQIRY